ncbi:MAG: acyl carrier protein [Acidobacteria bacterium]|nr:MAG: acyl carrier protein [Acidobacteriota bacterium]RPJ75388.1 MAG: acyl carrier protein [Acidobacteriota bacterium]
MTPSADRKDGEILAGIEEVARKHLGWEGVLTAATPIAEAMALDSLRRLTLVVEIENRFRVCLEEEDEGALETVADLVEAIKRRSVGRESRIER